MNEKTRIPTAGAIGLISWDQILAVESYPEAGAYRIVRESIEQSGGTTGNTAAALARLGVDVAIASRVGNDTRGRQIVEDLLREGCNVDHITIVDDEPTDGGLMIVSGTGVEVERTVFWIQGARPRHGQHLPIEEFFARDLVILDVDDRRLRLLLLDLPMHVSPRTRIFGTMTFLIEFEPETGLDLALRHDYLSGSESELRYLTQRTDLNAAVERFQDEMIRSQVRFAAISRGIDGCLMVTRDTVIEVPAFEVDARDPTGAGDAFAAGIAYAILNRWELHSAGRFANAVGALATRELGARTSLPTRDEVEWFLASARTRSGSTYASQGK